MLNLNELQVGDYVIRELGAGGPTMRLEVTKVDEKTVECHYWTFSKSTGGEIDLDLGWDGVNTGSRLIAKD